MGFALTYVWLTCFVVTLVMTTIVAILMAAQPAKRWTVVAFACAAMWALADALSNAATTALQLELLSHVFVFAWALLPFAVLRAVTLYVSADRWTRSAPLTVLLAAPVAGCVILNWSNLLHASWIPSSANGHFFQVEATGWHVCVTAYYLVYVGLASMLLHRSANLPGRTLVRRPARLFVFVAIPATVAGLLFNGSLPAERPLPFIGSVLVCTVSVAFAAGILRRGYFIPLARARRWAEDAIRASDGRYRTLMETSPYAIAVVDLTGNVVAVSESAKRMFQLSGRDGLPSGGLRASELVDRAERDRLCGELQMLLERQRPHGLALTGVRRNGEAFPMEVNANVILAEDGTTEGILCMARDVSNRARIEKEHLRLQEQLLHAQKLESLGLLASGVAHDFNNILSAVLGNAGLALRCMPAGSPARPFVQTIEQAARSASMLTRQLLAYTGRGSKLVVPFDLSSMTEELARVLRVSIPRSVDLELDLAPRLPVVEADPGQIQQVVMNLISNAAQAIGDRPGRILLRTGESDVAPGAACDYCGVDITPGRYASVEVSDTGPGIPPEVQPRIFDPFFTTKGSGRGLGLAAVLGIINNHGGAVVLDTAPSRGTSFRVLLPLSRAARSNHATASGERAIWPRFAGQVVLVVEPNPAELDELRTTLEGANLTVLAASDGPQAVSLFLQHASEVLAAVLDADLSGSDLTLASACMREIRADLPLVWMTGRGSNGPDRSSTGLLAKPFAPSDLLARLASLTSGQCGYATPTVDRTAIAG